MQACYIVRRDRISSPDLECFQYHFARFHELRQIFIWAGVRVNFALPRQHALSHYYRGVQLFGSPNGLCSSITESKHITAVKEPWRRSNRFEATSQMLTTTTRTEKMQALFRCFDRCGKLEGSCAGYTAQVLSGEIDESRFLSAEEPDDDNEAEGEDDVDKDVAPATIQRAQSSVIPAARHRTHGLSSIYPQADLVVAERGYPTNLEDLARHIQEPQFIYIFRRFLFYIDHPNATDPPTLDECPNFSGRVHVHHSAVALYHAPSDLCGTWGMHRQRIRSTPRMYGKLRRDTVLVELGDNPSVMKGMVVARLKLIYSFRYVGREHTCALVNWILPSGFDDDTGLWMVRPERDRRGNPTVDSITLGSIVRGIHLLPVYGETQVPHNFDPANALDAFKLFFVNKFIDYHAHELLS